jgi:hypothetical protein
MSDLAKWNVHGPVHTLRTEFAAWDLSLEQWQTAQSLTLVWFHPDGRTSESESHNPDGSVSRCSYAYDSVGRMQGVEFRMNDGPTSRNICFYDGLGRLTRVVSVDQDGTERESETYHYSPDGTKTKVYSVPKLGTNAGFAYGIEGTAQAYTATGAATIATRHDDRGHPDEVLFYDKDHRLLKHVIFTRDGAGRLIKEEMHLGEQIPFPELERALDNAAPRAREAVAAVIANLVSSTTYAHDEEGRLLERRILMGTLGDQRTTFRYDNHDNPIEETTEDTSREMQVDEEGTLRPTKENSYTQDTRFEYRYDAQGNWTERVVWSRLSPNPNFERSNVVRREITYYPG